eukprot:5382853-Ditylum_brightwellii.AAC.1
MPPTNPINSNNNDSNDNVLPAEKKNVMYDSICDDDFVKPWTYKRKKEEEKGKKRKLTMALTYGVLKTQYIAKGHKGMDMFTINLKNLVSTKCHHELKELSEMSVVNVNNPEVKYYRFRVQLNPQTIKLAKEERLKY